MNTAGPSRFLLVTALAGAVAMTSCRKDERPEEILEKQLAKQLPETEVDSVTCPDGVEAKEGVTSRCIATIAGGEQVPIEAEWSKGRYSLRIRRTAWLIGKLEQRITEELAKEYEVKIEGTSCPEVKNEKGTAFQCIATIEGGSKLPVTVTWTDDEGGYRFADKGVVLLDKAESVLEAQLEAKGVEGEVDCKGKIHPSEPGSTVTCAISYADGKTGAVKITVDDWNGHIQWEYE